MKTMVIFNGKRMNFYEFFEVAEKATFEELKSAYRKMCLRFHPDKHQGSKLYEDNFKSIQAIWGIIGDNFNRQRYDLALAVERGPSGVHVTVKFSESAVYAEETSMMWDAFQRFQAQQENRREWSGMGSATTNTG